MAPSIPPVTAALLAALLLASCVAYLSPASHAALMLLPGHTVLGEHAVWNVLTAFLIETHPVKLCVSVGLLLLLSPRSEPQPLRGMSRRLALSVLLPVTLTGLLTSFTCLMMYLTTAQEQYLYAPLWGSAPVAVAVAVTAHQVGGDAPIAGVHVAPWVTYSSMPLLVLVVAGVGTYLVPVSRDFLPALLTWVLAWAYLRFVHDYGTPGVVGDVRDEFEFLVMMPTPLRTPLRPLVKLISAVFMPLGIFARAKGLGVTSLPPSLMEVAGGASVAAFGGDAKAGRGAADPVAERRRERALAALDKKLSELRQSMRGPTVSSGSVATVASATAPPLPADANGAAGSTS